MTRDDASHLKILSICYYVKAGLNVLGGCLALFYIGLGALFLSDAPRDPRGNGPPPELGWLFVGVGVFAAILAWVIAALMALTGYSLARRRRYTCCLVMAGLACLSVPLGTILGVFSFIVLLRPGVKEEFEYVAAYPGGEGSDWYEEGEPVG